ncbi:hypothetical protein TVAG_051150 [Trichomonas vaginalis G3]|uniref:Uncharacterized protein n=1 Tax=Trichomonas vaginalis (strain ATCC PRA-98 / G3) TaxID=412133 RepID=A2EES4_TRIV3|nr:hypothetical protein TVAGG3_0982100 [Trichomonas vaginalis G3]EAY08880.1 hypothetical protein TVAG_051150 [Trichomonas vaginalis G3]KAI5489375.1 hypothetical protein TVAGG3_0982100 [Trichomonas vaginalis G3]|eukprot:XP_001321103.1 hypothetical protein [Trichomonas vaginalis G3]
MSRNLSSTRSSKKAPDYDQKKTASKKRGSLQSHFEVGQESNQVTQVRKLDQKSKNKLAKDLTAICSKDLTAADFDKKLRSNADNKRLINDNNHSSETHVKPVDVAPKEINLDNENESPPQEPMDEEMQSYLDYLVEINSNLLS